MAHVHDGEHATLGGNGPGAVALLEDDAKDGGCGEFTIGERVSAAGAVRIRLSAGLSTESPGAAAFGRGTVALAAWAAQEDWGLAVQSG